MCLMEPREQTCFTDEGLRAPGYTSAQSALPTVSFSQLPDVLSDLSVFLVAKHEASAQSCPSFLNSLGSPGASLSSHPDSFSS